MTAVRHQSGAGAVLAAWSRAGDEAEETVTCQVCGMTCRCSDAGGVGRDRQLVGLALQMTAPGMPVVFMGDEIGPPMPTWWKVDPQDQLLR